MATTIKHFVLRHPGGCTGMFWRNDPKVGGTKGGSYKPDWPRNGAELKGVVHNLDSAVESCKEWLEVHEYLQAGESTWVATPGCWLQFDQSGKLLHEKSQI